MIEVEERVRKTHLLVITILLFLSAPAVNAEKMTGDQIKKFFSGKTCDIEIVNREDKNKLAAYMAPDGKRIVYLPWKNKKNTRKWWVEGDKFCGDHPKLGDYCRNMILAGNGEVHAKADNRHLRTFTNCRDGNQL